MRLGPFTAAYVECALWASGDDDHYRLRDRHDVADLAPQTLHRMLTDCAQFQANNAGDVQSNPEQAGHDFWLTRNRHGAGFWDGDWPDEVGKRLTRAAHTYGEQTLYVGDDGLIYVGEG